MFATFGRSWELGKQSLRVLRQDKQLMVFPLISAIACFLVLASFIVPFAITIDWQTLEANEQARAEAVRSPLYYVVLFAFYFVNYTVIAFFNSALVACVLRRFEGKPASVGDGLSLAAARLPQILGWAVVASTVGMILRAISERAGLLGKLIIGLIGFVWTVATYFVVPVLVVEGVGPIEAVKRSAASIRKTWGESLVTNLGLGAMSFVGFFIAMTPLVIGIILAVGWDSPVPFLVGLGLTFVLAVALALVTSTLKMILVAALYRYAAVGEAPVGFDRALLDRAFKQKGRKAR